jgi:glutamate 5-kinase
MTRELCTAAKRVVIKIGSNVLVGDGGRSVDRGVFAPLVKSIASQVQQHDRKIVLVSSGAVALGRRRLEAPRENPGISYLQAVAALGQSALMQLYEQEFAFYNLLVGQLLLTQADIDDRKRFINARHTLKLLAENLGAVPIVNENDTVANEEIRLGDNDRLAALVAALFEADLLLVLSDVSGLMSANPKQDPDAELLPRVTAGDDALHELIWDTPTGPGRGGMATKLEAARIASSAGIATVIASGREPDVVGRVLDGERLGTLLVPPQSSVGARRHWLLHGVASAGRVVVDAGAVTALLERGTSLLPSGIVDVEGRFSEGAAVDIVGPGDAVIARGLASYSSSDIRRIQGKKSREIAGVLGFKNLDEVVHRDDLVIVAHKPAAT